MVQDLSCNGPHWIVFAGVLDPRLHGVHIRFQLVLTVCEIRRGYIMNSEDSKMRQKKKKSETRMVLDIHPLQKFSVRFNQYGFTAVLSMSLVKLLYC